MQIAKVKVEVNGMQTNKVIMVQTTRFCPVQDEFQCRQLTKLPCNVDIIRVDTRGTKQLGLFFTRPRPCIRSRDQPFQGLL